MNLPEIVKKLYSNVVKSSINPYYLVLLAFATGILLFAIVSICETLEFTIRKLFAGLDEEGIVFYNSAEVYQVLNT
jgi:hypothetical protein